MKHVELPEWTAHLHQAPQVSPAAASRARRELRAAYTDADADAIFREEFRARARGQFTLGLAAAAHGDFLRTLLWETWTESMQRAGADPDQEALRPLLDLQVTAREQAYAAAYPEARHYVVSRCSSGAPIGRMLIDWSQRAASAAIDVSVRPSERAGAAGLQLLRAWVATCDQLGRTARLHVTPDNPARRIYERLGFVALNSEAFPIPMQRAPRTREHGG